MSLNIFSAAKTALLQANHILALDANVIKVLVFRVWTIFAGVITVFFIPQYLDAQAQGFFFTFLSIVAIQALFDLGLSQIITQISSHEYSHVTGYGIGIEDRHRAKLFYIKSLIRKWYFWATIIFLVLVMGFGIFYFSIFSTSPLDVWVGPWLLLITATAVNLCLTPRFAMVEGAGWTGQVAMVRLVQSVLGYALLIGLLVGGAQLWSVAAVPVTAAVCSFCWLRWADNPYRQVAQTPVDMFDTQSWRQELLGLQWRVALSWVGGYMATQSIVPIVFAMRGAVDAGWIGLGLQIFSAVQTLGMSWISAKIPLFGSLISRQEWRSLRDHFSCALTNAVLVTVVLGAGVTGVLEVIRYYEPSITGRLPSSLVICLLAVTSVANTAVYAVAAYIRAHKVEPLVISSIVIGVLTVLGTAIAGFVSTNAVVVVFFAVTVFVNVPWRYLIYVKYRAHNMSMEKAYA